MLFLLWIVIEKSDPFLLSVGIEGIGPDPDEDCFPSCFDFHLVGIFCMAFIQWLHGDVMVPYRNMFIAFMAADLFFIKTDDVDGVGPEWNETE